MLVTSCPGIGCGQWGQILHHIMHHAHSGFLLSQRNSHCSTFMKYKIYLVKYKRVTLTLLQRELKESYLRQCLFLTCRADVFEGGGCSHTEGLL